MTVQVGDRAPNFTGIAVEAGEVRDFELADEIGHGPLVLAFFPFTFSGGCTSENAQLRDEHDRFAAIGARVLAVSIDSYFSHRAFAASLDLPFMMVSDGRRQGIHAYGIAYDEFLGVRDVAKRAVFVVDSAGVVQYAWVTEDADVLPDLDEVLVACGELV